MSCRLRLRWDGEKKSQVPAALEEIANVVVAFGHQLECFLDDLLLHVLVLCVCVWRWRMGVGGS